MTSKKPAKMATSHWQSPCFRNTPNPSPLHAMISSRRWLAQLPRALVSPSCHFASPLASFSIENLGSNAILVAACDSGSISVFEILMDVGGMDVNQRHELVGDPLTAAVMSGSTKLAKFLLSRGANPNSDVTVIDRTALM